MFCSRKPSVAVYQTSQTDGTTSQVSGCHQRVRFWLRPTKHQSTSTSSGVMTCVNASFASAVSPPITPMYVDATTRSSSAMAPRSSWVDGSRW